jgi:hypothetical protein
MSRSKFRLDPTIRDALNETGLPWEIVRGTKHYHVRVEGALVGILPMGKLVTSSRQLKNLLSDIHKLKRRQDAGPYKGERRVGSDSRTR